VRDDNQSSISSSPIFGASQDRYSLESNGTTVIPTDSDAGTVELEIELDNDQFKPTEDSFQLQPLRERLIAQRHGISRTSKYAIFPGTGRTLEFVDST
jgi:hypothetical protein